MHPQNTPICTFTHFSLDIEPINTYTKNVTALTIFPTYIFTSAELHKNTLAQVLNENRGR